MSPTQQQNSPASLNGLTSDTLTEHSIATIASQYHQDGMVLLPGFFTHDALYHRFYHDFNNLAARLMTELALTDDAPSLDEKITLLAQHDRPTCNALYDLGTGPNKLMSGLQFKSHPVLLKLIQAIFGEDAIIATPYQSDTFYYHSPHPDFYRFNLPIHQDYPYLMQSPEQITIIVGLSRTAGQELGATRFWLGSHKKGVRPTGMDTHGHFETQVSEAELAQYPCVDAQLGLGDLVISNSLILHKTVENRSTDRTRIIQLFRYSNLNHPEAQAMRWRSCEPKAKGIQFADFYPDLVRYTDT